MIANVNGLFLFSRLKNVAVSLKILNSMYDLGNGGSFRSFLNLDLYNQVISLSSNISTSKNKQDLT
uniref:Uncharacterized protein n=1 Tax=Rhizophagus irregularis (strain DAOM 181602 / DAOM 197198 / MUCL 43194) TaxID=747089 RepID=U9TNG9_RHIID